MFLTGVCFQLYNRRNDVTDDDALEDDHISEHLQVSEFSDSILVAHEQNYSVAAYRSLQRLDMTVFHKDDFAEVLKTLDFLKIAEISVESEVTGPDHLKLLSFFDSLLCPVPDASLCFYNSFHMLGKNSRSKVHEPNLLDVEDDDKSILSQISSEKQQNDMGDLPDGIDSGFIELPPQNFYHLAPIFVRFLINDVAVSVSELNRIVGASSISLYISTFKESSTQSNLSWGDKALKLLPAHAAAASELSSMLDAYDAELTLEKLRLLGRRLQESDVLQARTCLRNARNVLRCAVNIFLYSSKRDLVIQASSQIKAGENLDEVFDLLIVELKKSSSLLLKTFESISGFIVGLSDETDDSLPCWCFLNLHPSKGVVTIDICHPGGPSCASDLMNAVVESISSTCHRVNQLLLLNSLHASRTASRLLIPTDRASANVKEEPNEINEDNKFPDGHFECPVMYQTSFELFHRCAANPMKAIRSLEATVLHIFAVSNRQQLFVYKDESGLTFYMRLVVQEYNDERNIDFLVFGIEPPGPSITEQLRKRLEKRLLVIAVEMLTSVLTKNPHYHWRQLDISFIKSFHESWDVLDDNNSTRNVIGRNRTYAFPTAAFDPGMITIIFRQNLCGSTFFHPLSTSEWENTDGILQEPLSPVDDALRFESTDLVFYYNSSSSNLDPNLQSESTLTSKGAYYSGQTGSGLAVIEVSLLSCEGKVMRTMNAAIPALQVKNLEQMTLSSLCFQRVDVEFSPSGVPVDVPAFLRVSVADTSLQTDVLHEWIFLCLNQAVIGWTIERHLERMQKGLLLPNDGRTFGTGTSDREKDVDQVCLGLPSLLEILELAETLPHPTSLRMEFSGVFRSSSVASVAQDLFEKVILDQIRMEMRVSSGLDKFYKLVVIRSSRSSKPQIVELDKDVQGRVVVRVLDDRSSQHIVLSDSPTDCPQYTLFFYTPEYTIPKDANQNISFPKLFQEVAVGYSKSGEKGDHAKSLFDFKRRHLACFRRSFSFIFSVKRNQRTLITYNWSSLLFKRVVAKLTETENLYLVSLAESVQSLQRHCLGLLAPISNVRAQGTKEKSDVLQTKGKESDLARTEIDRPSGLRPSTLPLAIRRPKLVGKSVEGSALQAVAKSRARASASRYRNTVSSGSIVATKPQNIVANEQKTSRGGPNEQTQATSNVVKPQDQELVAVHRLLENSFCTRVMNQSMIRNTICQKVMNQHWPYKSTQFISHSLADYLFLLGTLTWTVSCVMIPFPKSLSEDFLLSFGRTLASWTPGLSLFRIQEFHRRNSIFLVGKTRILRTCRAFVCVRISTTASSMKRKQESVVCVECRVFALPKQKDTTRHSTQTPINQRKIEHGAAGLDKLSADIARLRTLQGLLLDHSAFIVERTMKSASKTEDYDEVVSIVKPIIDMFPLQKAMTTIRSNYKVRHQLTSLILY